MSNIELKIWEEGGTRPTTLIFPPGEVPNMKVIGSTFPGAIGLQYFDTKSDLSGVVMFRENGDMLEPPNGYAHEGRFYQLRYGKQQRKEDGVNYAEFLEKKKKERLTPITSVAKKFSADHKERNRKVTIKVRIGRFTSKSDFRAVHSSSKQFCGGSVNLANLDGDHCKANDILEQAIAKFADIDQRFDPSIGYKLCMKDGREIPEKLNGEPFSIKRYAAWYTVKHYDRLPFFLCPLDNFHGLVEAIEDVSDVVSEASSTASHQEMPSEISTTSPLEHNPAPARPFEIPNIDYRRRYLPYKRPTATITLATKPQSITRHETSERAPLVQTSPHPKETNAVSAKTPAKLPPSHLTEANANSSHALPRESTKGPKITKETIAHSPPLAYSRHHTATNKNATKAFLPAPLTHPMEMNSSLGNFSLRAPIVKSEPEENRDNNSQFFSSFSAPASKFSKVALNQALFTFGKTIPSTNSKEFQVQKLSFGKDLATISWSKPAPLTLFVEDEKFSEGGMRVAYRAKRENQDKMTYVVKKHKRNTLMAFTDRYGDLNTAMEKLCEREIQSQTYARLLAEQMQVPEEFGEKPLRKLRTLSGETYTLEPLLFGIWRKANINDGRIIDDKTERGQKLNTLTHWSIAFTDDQAAIIDLQGVDLQLSDVEIATRSESLFGAGNVGAFAIDKFKGLHKCSRFCKMLSLKEFNQGEDIDSIFGNSVIQQGAATPVNGQVIAYNLNRQVTPPTESYTPIDTEVFWRSEKKK